MFCDPKEPIKVCTRFRARVLIFNIEVPITKGFPVSLCESSCVHDRLLGAFPLHVQSPEYERCLVSASGLVSLEETDSSAIWIGCFVAAYAYSYWLLIYS